MRSSLDCRIMSIAGSAERRWGVEQDCFVQCCVAQYVLHQCLQTPSIPKWERSLTDASRASSLPQGICRLLLGEAHAHEHGDLRLIGCAASTCISVKGVSAEDTYCYFLPGNKT